MEAGRGLSLLPASLTQASLLQAPFPNEDICYATVSLDTSDQEPTYSNMDSLISDLPNRSHEGPTEYSSVRML